MFEIKKQDNNERKPLATLGDLKLACVELGISDDKHTLKRASRAFDLYNSGKVEHLNARCDADGSRRNAFRADHTFAVKSQYRERLPYQVHISKSGTSYCTCPDWRNYSGDLVLPDVHFHCKHAISARIWLHHNGNGWRVRSHALGSKMTSECGTSEAKALQEKLNGSNGTGDNQSPVHYQLDVTNPFEESEALDIEQINGNGWRVRSHALGDLVHHLSNGEYIISYHGIMALAEQHGVTFTKHTDEQEAKDTRTVIAHARCGNNTRASGKPMNGSFITAVELAKRNAARQLLPLVEIKALEKKTQLEADFDWQVAKRKCLEIVPHFTFELIIHDLVKADTLRQAHPSDYKRKEWLTIFDACKHDAETNGNDDNDDGGANTPSSDEQREVRLCHVRFKTHVREHSREFGCLENAIEFQDSLDPTLKEGSYIVDTKTGEVIGNCNDEQPSACDRTRQAACCICGRTLTNKLSISRCVGPECFKKVGAQGAQFLRDDEVSDELIEASQLYQDEALKKRILRACLTLDAPAPVKVLNWLGNEYFGYRNRPILYYFCADRQLNRIDTNKRKLRHVIVTSETAETELDAHALAQMAADVADPSEPKAEVPDNADEFIAKCKQAEAEVEDTIEDVDDTPTNGDGKRKLQMDKKLNTWLIEPDGTKKPFSCREICEQFDGNIVMQLRAGIDSGGDISTVELDN